MREPIDGRNSESPTSVARGVDRAMEDGRAHRAVKKQPRHFVTGLCIGSAYGIRTRGLRLERAVS